MAGLPFFFGIVLVCNLTWSRCDLYQSDQAFKTEEECAAFVQQKVAEANDAMNSQAAPDELNYPRIVTFGFCHLRLGPRTKA